MFTFKIIFSFILVAIAAMVVYNNKKTKARVGTNMIQGKVKTKSNVKLLFGAVLAIVVISAIIGAVKSGLNDGTVLSIGVIFYICCFIYIEHNNFIISRSGVMYNQLAVNWDSVESFEWEDNQYKIMLRTPSKVVHGVITVDNKQKKDIDRILKKHIKK